MTSSSTFGYARPEDGAYIAYRVDGDGPIDIVWQPDWTGNIDMEWADPLTGAWLRELASFARVITRTITEASACRVETWTCRRWRSACPICSRF